MEFTARRRNARVIAALSASTALLGAAAITAVPGEAIAAPSTASRINPGPQQLKLPSVESHLASMKGVPSSGRYAFLLRLDTKATATVYNKTVAKGRANAAPSAARQQLSRVTEAQNAVVSDLPAKTPVLYRLHSVMAGVAVTTDVRNLDALAAIPGVAKVYPIAPKSFNNSYAVPFQGAAAVWQGNGQYGQNATIGVIDTGIDYTHADFGGPGTTAAYNTAHSTETQPADPSLFPTSKIVGGYDLVGDSYDAAPTDTTYQPVPHPDTNPLDCNGHGSHVAGTAAGFGENADGSTYTGAYNTSTPFDTMKIGPGMAPQAKLMSFRVFGCNGSTDVTSEAIDMATDPNGDGSPADAVDVINMSLGSDYGNPDDADAITSDAAVDAGVEVAISSGNSNDLYDVGGSPGSAVKAITAAASIDAQSVVDGVTYTIAGSAPVTAAASRAILYDFSSKPDLTGTAVMSPADNLTACTPYSSADAATISGKVVVVKWTQEALECGSIARGANLRNAGAAGFIFANSAETFSAGINGDSVIPGVLIAKSGGDAIKAALAAGTVVTINGTSVNSVKQTFPADNDKMTSFSSRGPRGNGSLKPDVAAVGATVFSVASGSGNGGTTESGTSMASPMVAGLSALVISQHPTWTPEQVKADIMNTAGADLYVNGSADPTSARYAPNRVGAGRIEAQPALNNDVVAYDASDPGAVSVSFGPVAVADATTMSKTVKVENLGTTAETYATSYDAITSVPGVSYVVSPSSLTVQPGSFKNVTVTFTAPDPSALTNTVDATHGRTDPSGLPLNTLADASGNLLLTPAVDTTPQLRVPVYSAPRPASTTSQAATLTLPTGDTQSADLALTGTGVSAGTDEDSLTSLAEGMELQATSGVAPACSTTVTALCTTVKEDSGADLKYVGITSDYPLYADPDSSLAYFGITTQGANSTAAGKSEFDIYLDTDGDGTPDLVAYNTRLTGEDVFVTNLVDLSTGAVVDQELTNGVFGDTDTAAFDSDTLILPVYLGALTDYGVDAADPRVSYGIDTFSDSTGALIDSIGVDPATGDLTSGALSADLYTPGVSVVDSSGAGPLVADAGGTSLEVTRNLASYTADGGQGLLMLHLFDKVGSKAQVVGLGYASTTALTVSPTSVVRGAKATLSATVAGAAAGDVPTGSVTFKHGGTVIGTADLTAGVASLSFTPTTPGTYPITATYSGDSGYLPSVSTAAALSVTKAVPTVKLSLNAATGTVGRIYTVKVAIPTISGIPATGSLKFTNYGQLIKLVSVKNGSAVFSYKAKKPGTYGLRAIYLGDGNYTKVRSNKVAFVVKK